MLSLGGDLQSAHRATKRGRRAGFSLVEVVIGVAIMGLVAASIIWGLNQLITFSTASRLYTAAETLAQNQVDLVLTKGPFNPQLNPAQYPTPNVLQNGTTYYSDPSTPDTLYSTPRLVPIYTDPMSNAAVVTGTIATTISDPGFAQSGTNLNVRQAVVTVSYTFRNTTYNVSMNTMRTADQ
jgi:prepilin-type N-terminal cleavage/methylation domain-containing protein